VFGNIISKGRSDALPLGKFGRWVRIAQKPKFEFLQVDFQVETQRGMRLANVAFVRLNA
jgi:hypothetical protein